jgi:hypothetical protein
MTKKTKDKINFEKRKFGTNALSGILPSMMKQLGGAAEAKKAASMIRVLNHWPDIIGAEMATRSMPLKVGFRKQKNRETGEQISIRVLKIKAESGIVTAIAMREAIICQRLNTLFGTDDFQKLDIEHGTVAPQKKTSKKKQTIYNLDLPDINDPVLKDRLESLGQAVMNSEQN